MLLVARQGMGLNRAAVPENTGRPPVARWNVALFALSLTLAVVLYTLPFLRAAPNRLLSGEPVYFMALMQGPSLALTWVIALLLAALLALSFTPIRPVSLWAALVAAVLLLPGLVWLAASHAAFIAQAESPVARTSLGGGFWLALLLAGLVAGDALQRLQTHRISRGLRGLGGLGALVLAAVALPICAMVWANWCNELSIMKEYANRADVFVPTVLRHLEIVGVSVFFTLAIGLPLGWLVYRHGRIGKTLFPVLNIIQTIPSIALFGLLMAPLALLAAAWPALGKAGVSGVGLAPGVIALTLYSLLPVVRGMLTGLDQVSSSVIEAARGLGMSAGSIFWRVEVPLALPVVLGGVRTATIQAVGLAAVTALIGAGGLGAIMFEGLFANAQDLVLLGVVPIVVLGALTDLVFKSLINWCSLTGVSVLSGRPNVT